MNINREDFRRPPGGQRVDPRRPNFAKDRLAVGKDPLVSGPDVDPAQQPWLPPAGRRPAGPGTLSGPVPEQAACLLELTQGGRQALTLPGPTQRHWLEDGDTVVLRA